MSIAELVPATSFLACEPLAGWRHVAITERRNIQDFAHQMQWLADVAYPNAPVIRVVLDNLNIHRMASLYETPCQARGRLFPAAEARRIVKRLEFHHTPKHASWLNMAEIEFSVLSRDCLRGRHDDEAALVGAIDAYQTGATSPRPPSTGASAPKMPAPNSIASIPAIPELIRY